MKRPSHEVFLSSADATLADLIERIGGHCELSVSRTPFDDLARSIISQQLSAKAARTIKSRVCKMAGTPMNPERFARIPAKRLREAGLSTAKCAYIRELASKVFSGDLDLYELQKLPNRTVIDKLVEQRGIGLWTAQMFLIFACGRTDVLATKDAGLRRAIRLFYGRRLNSDEEFQAFAERWKPYRSFASLYLWRALDKNQESTFAKGTME